MKRILILGGTGEAVQLAAKASMDGVEIITSLAGRTRNPINPVGEFRIGGFGGQTGLVNYLQNFHIDVLIDATHPFAAQITLNAAAAAKECNIPHLMLIRPVWEKLPNDLWLEVDSIEDTATALQNQAKRVFLTIGRQELTAFAHLREVWFLMRMIDPPLADAVVPQGMFLYNRGPFTLEQERDLLLHYNIDTLVSKNSGGMATYAKIAAARQLGIKVVMVKRPPIPLGEQVSDVDSAIAWLINKIIRE
jgi:precorrin-6A/cobalt-precorrin-6A reductase